MTKFVWLSDLHFVAEGTVQKHNPRKRLEAAISHINANHSDARFCVISGDMVDRGTEEDYAALGKALQSLQMPFYPMVGNHDNRELFRRHMPLPNNSMKEFVQFVIETDDAVLLCLDTLDFGVDAGDFCAERQAWLSEKLDQYTERPVLLLMHHPPMPLGLPMQDQDRMLDGLEFLEQIKERSNIVHMCIGHVHRPVTGTVYGIPFTTMRSVLYQAPPPRPAWDWTNFKPAQEAPSLGVVVMDESCVTIQFDQFCDYELGVEA